MNDRLPLSVALGDVVNRAYQGGMDDDTCRVIAQGLRAALPVSERATFTEAVEMCGLWLDGGANA